ncbi:MAG: hypothetical protein JWO30_4177 [Fibrobacteres bacterium]|nr:hypothetical protein [Fibrobacterota bacterium]
MGFIALLVLGILFSQEDSNVKSGVQANNVDAPQARSIAEATDMLFASEGSKDTLKVKFYRKAVWDEAGWIHTMASGVLALGKFLKENLPDSFSVVKILAYSPSTDKYGNDEAVPAMLLVYNGRDFDKINYDNFNEWKMLNLVERLKFEPIGLRAAKMYCQDEDHARFAQSFCMKVLASALSDE